MSTRTDSRRARHSAPPEVRRTNPGGFVLDEEEHVPSSEQIVMDQACEFPALMEHLRECGSRTSH